MSRSRLIAVVGAKTHPCLTQVPTVDGVEFLKGGVAEFEAMTSNKLNEVEAMICCSLDSTLTDGLIKIFPTMPNIRWVHSFPAGVDTIAPFIKEHLIPRDIPLTNGRSAFSSSLAEWVLTACFYFNKQIPRCMSNRAAKRWDRFNMDVVDTKTIGFVGFGDISQLSAKYCKAVGMRVLAMRRNVGKDDGGLADQTYSTDQKAEMFAQCDYVVSVLPGTPETLYAPAFIHRAPEWERVKRNFWRDE
ncbi:D-isomer specific 2-hydroxyacid dehydrogenase-protein [Diplonema papillatum]|nr:D-isomer specific 2-hydroxyacid dehydrogenase-protein [Diplonema papillatum]